MLKRLLKVLFYGLAMIWALPYMFLSVIMIPTPGMWESHSGAAKIANLLVVATGWPFVILCLLVFAIGCYIVRGRRNSDTDPEEAKKKVLKVGAVIVLSNAFFTLVMFALMAR